MKAMSIASRAFALAFAGMMFLTGVACAAEIRVMISGGFAVAYGELVPEFERATGHKVVTARGGSMGTAPNSIPSRLQRGEPVDLFVMVGDALEDLAKQGKVAAGTRVDLARSRIGVAVRAGSPKPDIGRLTRSSARCLTQNPSRTQPARVVFISPRSCFRASELPSSSRERAG